MSRGEFLHCFSITEHGDPLPPISLTAQLSYILISRHELRKHKGRSLLATLHVAKLKYFHK